MIKCLECGFETETRLQWSHFKFNCSGKFKNGKEYQEAHSGAPIIDELLSKKYAITEKNMVAKYGEIEGGHRWKKYCDKQAESNSFAYKQKKYGWTQAQYDDYNSSRAQTLAKMIQRYGEIGGTEKWISYCDRQGYTNTKDYFTEKYGKEIGTTKYIEVCKMKAAPHDPNQLAEKLGISRNEAIQIIIERGASRGFIVGSNLETEFINALEKEFGKLEYTTLNKPYGKWSSYLNSYVLYDVKHGECVIEFNGDYWHANPNIYNDGAIIRGRTAIEIQQRDKKKLQTVLDLGFRVLTIWEAEYKACKHETIKKVIKWMQNGQQ